MLPQTAALPEFAALRVIRAFRRGSSLPVLVETPRGDFVAKLRGAAQGSAALISECLVSDLAEQLGLPVPERAVLQIPEDIDSDDQNDELLQLLGLSVGKNLGVRFLEGAEELRADRADRVDAELAARVLWLDAWVLNMDRSARNPNILSWHGQHWLIDHGAALTFQHDWDGVTEQDPRETPYDLQGHLFAAHTERMRAIDEQLARRFSLERLVQAAQRIPQAFLQDAFPRGTEAGRSEARRLPHAYAAFLWKRLKAPRPWV
ncbi:MAG: HipA family kinase [Polyangiaceae bacterium]